MILNRNRNHLASHWEPWVIVSSNLKRPSIALGLSSKSFPCPEWPLQHPPNDRVALPETRSLWQHAHVTTWREEKKKLCPKQQLDPSRTSMARTNDHRCQQRQQRSGNSSPSHRQRHPSSSPSPEDSPAEEETTRTPTRTIRVSHRHSSRHVDPAFILHASAAETSRRYQEHPTIAATNTYSNRGGCRGRGRGGYYRRGSSHGGPPTGTSTAVSPDTKCCLPILDLVPAFQNLNISADPLPVSPSRSTRPAILSPGQTSSTTSTWEPLPRRLFTEPLQAISRPTREIPVEPIGPTFPRRLAYPMHLRGTPMMLPAPPELFPAEPRPPHHLVQQYSNQEIYKFLLS